MQFAKLRAGGVVAVADGSARLLDLGRRPGISSLADLLAAADAVGAAEELAAGAPATPFAGLALAAPVDRQEVWAAGVTYKRSKVARQEESQGAAVFYDKVYTADRPELFFKATPDRVSGPGGPIRVRADSRWSVPEPELALVVSPDLRIVGYTVGNDVSARDIEGENPLYLPQAKVYHGACALGPVVTPARDMPPLPDVSIRVRIRRAGAVAFEGATAVSAMARSVESLVDWLGRENQFPNGVILMTGTGVVPPDDFTLYPGDEVSITIDGIGTLTNTVGS